MTTLFATNTGTYDPLKALFETAETAIAAVKTKSDIVGQKEGELEVWKVTQDWAGKKSAMEAGKSTFDADPNTVAWKEADARLTELVAVKSAATDLQAKMDADAVKKEKARKAQILIEEKLKKQEQDKAAVMKRKKEM